LRLEFLDAPLDRPEHLELPVDQPAQRRGQRRVQLCAAGYNRLQSRLPPARQHHPELVEQAAQPI